MSKFIKKLLFYLSPVLIILFIYLYKDPFKVLYHYDPYYASVDSYYFERDGDFISTQTLIQNFPSHHYDSYIFGSSRSGNYLMSEWSRHIGSNNCYHYDASWESLYGVERKFALLKKRQMPIKNALLVFDHELLSNIKNDKGHLRIKHPLLSGQNVIAFQGEFLKDYFDKDFLYAYLDLLITGRVKQYMIDENIMSPGKFKYNASTNEYEMPVEDRIQKDSAGYYLSQEHVLYERDNILHYGKPILGAVQKEMLNNIKAILAENSTRYKVVISPLYDQLKLDTTDLRVLQEIFNKEHVYDFSGINDITRNKFNYYETSHYRIRVCTEIMNTIYR